MMLKRTVGILTHRDGNYVIEPEGIKGAQVISSFFNPLVVDDICRDLVGEKVELIWPNWDVDGVVAAKSEILFSLRAVPHDTPDCLCEPLV